MKKLLVISILAALAFAGCSRKSGSNEASLKENSAGSAPIAKYLQNMMPLPRRLTA